ncbi:MAG: sigma factor-like helix-turn-helix DNA-binding protein [Gemmatimonadota bacterium]|nr:sigma factor-like helix-turn-helix DNA-binding protein [Gemmatimonadota bacterium]
MEGYTHVEIGEALGVAPGTSRSQLFKARAKLREWFAPRNARRATDRRRSCPT